MSTDPDHNRSLGFDESELELSGIDRRQILGLPTIVLALSCCGLAARLGAILLLWPSNRAFEHALTAPFLAELLASTALVPASYLLSRWATEAAGDVVSHAAGVAAAGFVAYWPGLVVAPALEQSSVAALATLSLVATLTALQRCDRAVHALLLAVLACVAATILILLIPLTAVAAIPLSLAVLLSGRAPVLARAVAALLLAGGSAAAYGVHALPQMHVAWPLPELRSSLAHLRAGVTADAQLLATLPSVLLEQYHGATLPARGAAAFIAMATLFAVGAAVRRGWTCSSAALALVAMLWVAAVARSGAAFSAATALALICIGWLVAAAHARRRAALVRSPLVRTYLARRLSNDGSAPA